MLGGAARPELLDLPEDLLQKRLEADLARTLRLDGIEALVAVTRWPRAVPQPGRDHRRLVEDIRGRLGPGLALAGAYLDGVAVADALASGARAAAGVGTR
jgi:oxygen-dependent protoporphyrinogen oxidase